MRRMLRYIKDVVEHISKLAESVEETRYLVEHRLEPAFLLKASDGFSSAWYRDRVALIFDIYPYRARPSLFYEHFDDADVYVAPDTHDVEFTDEFMSRLLCTEEMKHVIGRDTVTVDDLRNTYAYKFATMLCTFNVGYYRGTGERLVLRARVRPGELALVSSRYFYFYFRVNGMELPYYDPVFDTDVEMTVIPETYVENYHIYPPFVIKFVRDDRRSSIFLVIPHRINPVESFALLKYWMRWF